MRESTDSQQRPDTYEAVRRRIREIRQRQGMSQQGLSQRLAASGYDLSRDTLANIESGRRANITVNDLFALATALAVGPADLIAPYDEQQPGGDTGQELSMESEDWASGPARQTERAFGARVRALRLAHGWTQEELAERMTSCGLPMHQTTVAKLENAGRPTPVAEVAALAAIFETPISALFQPEQDALHHAETTRLAHALARLKHEIDTLAGRKDRLEAEYDQTLAAYRRARISRERDTPH